MRTSPARQKILVIVGPTSAGKSDFAVSLAKEFNGEVVSADSRQVYKGADLLSGKISLTEMKGVPHHILSIASMRKTYTVSRFIRDAKKAITGIQQRGRLPIICGGTAMYIDALIYNQIFPEVKPNKTLRKELSKKSVSELLLQLTKLDPERAKTIDTQNPRRLIRAIEIAIELGLVPAINYKASTFDPLIIGLSIPKEELDTKIKTRIHSRLSQGMKDEILQLHKSGVSYNRIKSFGLEFNWITQIVTKEIEEKTALEKLYFDTIHYAKRQRTWWKRNTDIHWLSPKEYTKAQKLIQDFL